VRILKAVVFVRIEEGQQGTEMIQVQLLNALTSKPGVNIVGYCFKSGLIPVNEILPIIQKEVKYSFDTIFIYNKDIISLNIKDVFMFVSECSSKGISVYTVVDGNLTEFVMSLMEAKVEQEKKDLSKVTVDRMAMAAIKGQLLGGRVTFGYRKRLDGKAEINPELVNIVREIFQLFADDCSITTITRVLSDKYGLCYQDSTKGRWRQNKVLRILENPIYNGFPAWGKTTQKNGKLIHLPKDKWIISETRIDELVIIEDDLWNKVQKKLQEKNHSKQIK
jgi:DNA invertase Pin-like site-specific DNA recombinase